MTHCRSFSNRPPSSPNTVIIKFLQLLGGFLPTRVQFFHKPCKLKHARNVKKKNIKFPAADQRENIP